MSGSGASRFSREIRDRFQPQLRVGTKQLDFPVLASHEKQILLRKAVTNGVREKNRIKITDFDLPFQLSHSTSPQQPTK